MSPRVSCPWLLALLLAVGCSRKDKESAPDTAGTPTPGDVVGQGEPDLGPLLAELTQAVRRYGFEKQKVPASLDELVAAGYLPSKPTAPAGRTFLVDPKGMQVVLKGN